MISITGIKYQKEQILFKDENFVKDFTANYKKLVLGQLVPNLPKLRLYTAQS